MSRKTTNTRRKSAAGARPAASKVSLYPVYLNFDPVDKQGTHGDRDFGLHLDRWENGWQGVELASVRINPALDDDTAFRFKMLFMNAPVLWRVLQDLIRKTEDVELTYELLKATETLWCASMTNPFGENAPFHQQDTERAALKLTRGANQKDAR